MAHKESDTTEATRTDSIAANPFCLPRHITLEKLRQHNILKYAEHWTEFQYWTASPKCFLHPQRAKRGAGRREDLLLMDTASAAM